MKRNFVTTFFVLLTAVVFFPWTAWSQNLDENGRLPRATAESQGVSSDVLCRLIETLRDDVNSPNSLMVLRHGKVIAECWWAPHSPETTHQLYSLSKSFTSTAAGFAVAEGKLDIDARLVDVFPEDVPENVSEALAKAKIRHLLSMSCGQNNEPNLPGLLNLDLHPNTDQTWVHRFMAHPFVHEPGTHFMYNTAGTFMVSAAVQKATGQTVRDYLIPRLFEPLQIQTPYWETSPEGISKGGTGLFLRTEDIAKVGQLYLQRGTWNGKQLLPAEWVDEATSFQVSNGSDPNSDWNQGYGFQFWRCRHNVYRGDGMFCQFMVVMPDQDMVVAMTSDSNGYQQILNILFDILLPEVKGEVLPENADAQARLATLEGGLIAKPGASGSVALENLTLQSTILGREMRYCIYLPNGYRTSGFDYPVVYLLHGGGDDGTGWLRKGDAKRIADEFFQGRLESAIIVMPECPDSRWRNDFAGENRFEDYFVQEFIPYIEQNFRCRTGREDRMVAGLSRGGYGSLLYALKHPDLFGSCFAMSAALRTHEAVRTMPEADFLRMYATCVAANHGDGDERLTDFFLANDIFTLAEKVPAADRERVRFYLDCGQEDFLLPGTQALHEVFERQGIPHEYRLRPGAHTWDFWKVSLKDALEWGNW